MHKSGFVNIIGNPNVGKSTLMNALVGERLSIITSKAQTTRHRILGIVSGDDFQIVYSDTPGILKPQYKLHEGMMQFVKTALIDADVILFVTDVFEKDVNNPEILERVQKTSIPVILIINKIDQASVEKIEELKNYWQTLLPKAEIIAISALQKINTDTVIEKIKQYLPEGEPYFPKDQLTDKPERFFVAEIIREKIFLNYKKEIPYSCEVVIESYKEEPDIVKINAVIFVARESQKPILIGENGKAIKKVGTEARKEIEEFIQQKVFLELTVKVSKDWRNNENLLKRYGYLNS
ncbi:MAG: GTPase Era [Bacteroidia bacterium]